MAKLLIVRSKEPPAIEEDLDFVAMHAPLIEPQLRERGLECAREATVEYARWWCDGLVPGAQRSDLDAMADELSNRLERSVAVEEIVTSSQPPIVVALILQRIAECYAFHQRLKVVARPVQETDPVSDLPTSELEERLATFKKLDAWLSEERRPVLGGQLFQSERTRKELQPLLQNAAVAVDARRGHEADRRHLPVRMPSPTTVIARAIADLWDRESFEQDRLAAKFAREILDDPISPQTIRERLKPHRRKKQRS